MSDVREQVLEAMAANLKGGSFALLRLWQVAGWLPAVDVGDLQRALDGLVVDGVVLERFAVPDEVGQLVSVDVPQVGEAYHPETGEPLTGHEVLRYYESTGRLTTDLERRQGEKAQGLGTQVVWSLMLDLLEYVEDDAGSALSQWTFPEEMSLRDRSRMVALGMQVNWPAMSDQTVGIWAEDVLKADPPVSWKDTELRLKPLLRHLIKDQMTGG